MKTRSPWPKPGYVRAAGHPDRLDRHAARCSPGESLGPFTLRSRWTDEDIAALCDRGIGPRIVRASPAGGGPCPAGRSSGWKPLPESATPPAGRETNQSVGRGGGGSKAPSAVTGAKSVKESIGMELTGKSGLRSLRTGGKEGTPQASIIRQPALASRPPMCDAPGSGRGGAECGSTELASIGRATSWWSASAPGV